MTIHFAQFLSFDIFRDAGFAGAALAVQAWSWQLLHGSSVPLEGIKPYSNEAELLKDIKAGLLDGEAKLGRPPKALVMGMCSVVLELGTCSYSMV